jgi:acetylornithine deacetylase/succinyl-diaminopimelate desuccinylase-like protein
LSRSSFAEYVVKEANMNLTEVEKKVIGKIDEKELVDLATGLGNITAPSGHEQPMADYVEGWLQKSGFHCYQQNLCEGRSNTIGILRGKGGGKNLIFNSHLDSDMGLPPLPGGPIPPGPKIRVEGRRIFGKTVQNDRGPMAAFMLAAKAIKDADVATRGDIIMTMVVGEIGMGPIDEFQGPRYIGKGYGSRHAVAHGIMGDFALVAESTDFGVTWIEAGAAYFKVTLKGTGYYTPRLPDRGALKDSPNPIVKMTAVIQAIEEWAARYEKNHKVQYPVGVMVPRVAIGAIRAGHPFSPSTGVDTCSIYVDVRVPPAMSFGDVEKELKEVVLSPGFGGDVQMYMTRRGYEGKNVEPLVDSIRKAHRAIRGGECPPVSTPEISMWRDINIFNEVGIPAATFGFPRKTELGLNEKFVDIDDLVDCAKMYALVALDICGADSD